MHNTDHRIAVLTALHAAARSGDVAPPELDWKRDGLRELAEDDYKEMYTTRADDHPARPTGNERLDRILRNARVPFRYGFEPATVQLDHIPEAFEGKIVNTSFIAFPPLDAFPEGQAGLRKTLAHELAHWAGKSEGGPSRESEGYGGISALFGIFPTSYAREEMTAETAATLLLDALGEDPDLPHRAAYVADWASAIHDPDERAEAYQFAAREAQRTVDWLLQFDHD